MEPFYEPNVYVESFDNDFQESLDCLDNLSKQNENQQQTDIRVYSQKKIL